MRVPCHPLKATDHAHSILLSFTQLLGKTLAIDQVKVKVREGRWPRLRGQDPFRSTCFLNFFFSPRARDRREENSGTQSSARKKRGRGPGRPTYLQLQAGQWTNFHVINHEPTPYSDAHVYAPYNLTQATAFSYTT
jgi:hypothetical protein